VSDVDIHIDYIGGNCPVQAEGTVGGKPFYFRARWDKWSMGIGGDPVLNPEFYREAPYGKKQGEAGWMPQYQALIFIAKSIREYAELDA
jgi:hypothetical protein